MNETKSSMLDTSPIPTQKHDGPDSGIGNGFACNRWNEPTRYIMGVFLIFAVLFVIYIGRSAIPLVASAALLALLVDPAIRFLAGPLKLNKTLATVIIYLLVVAALIIIPLLLIQPLVDAINFAIQIDPNLVVQRLSQVIQSISASLQDHRWIASVFNPALDTILKALNESTSHSAAPAPAMQMSVADLSGKVGKA